MRTKITAGKEWNDDTNPWMDEEVFTMDMTYDIIDPSGEAIKDGEPEETGFEYEDKKASAKDVLNEISNELGYFENFQEGASSQSLYGTDPDTDYSTGEETRYALHISGDKENMEKLNQAIKKYMFSGGGTQPTLSSEEVETAYSPIEVTIHPGFAELKLVDKEAYDGMGAEKLRHEMEDDLHDGWMVNHGYTWVAPEDVGALTDAPMFGDVAIEDDGTISDVHSLFYYNDYMLKDWCEELYKNGTVKFLDGISKTDVQSATEEDLSAEEVEAAPQMDFAQEALKNDFNGKVAQLQAKLPKLFKAIMSGPMADRLQGGINDVSALRVNGKTIYFIEEPGHGWYFDEQGICIGEEDGGLDVEPWEDFNGELPEAHKAAQVIATGEADGDYDTELFDAIVKKLKEHGFEATHKEFDKYQGPYLHVKGVDKFWIQDTFVTGKEKPTNAKYKKAVLIDENGDESSANAGDYFMMGPEETFEGCVLVLTDKNGKTTEIEEPKKKDLPDLSDVAGDIQFEGQPDWHIIFTGEDNPDQDPIEVIKYADGEVDAEEMVMYCEAMKQPEANASVTAAKQKDAKKARASTYMEALQELKQIYPDAEKILKRFDALAEKESKLQVNYQLSDSYIDNDKKIEGKDLELPYYLKDGFPHPNSRGYLLDESQAGKALMELGKMYPDVQKFITNPDNAYISWGETSGMMPYHHANYPDDAILVLIEGIDTEEYMDIETWHLAEVAKKKEDEKFMQFLEKCKQEHYLGSIYSLSEYGSTDGDRRVTIFDRVQYNYAVYYKLADVTKVVKKAISKDKNKEQAKKAKELMNDVKEGAGSYK